MTIISVAEHDHLFTLNQMQDGAPDWIIIITACGYVVRKHEDNTFIDVTLLCRDEIETADRGRIFATDSQAGTN